MPVDAVDAVREEMFDSHCHLTFDAFAGRVDQVVQEAVEAGVRGMITVSTTSENCEASLEIARRFDNVWCTAGVHPLYADEPVEWASVRHTIEHPKCVAWGEMGLDNYYDRPERSLQDRVLEEQFAVVEQARGEGVDKPIVLHCRRAVEDLLAVLRQSSLDPSGFVFHCFTESPADARRVLDFGAWISFTGVVTFANAPEVAEAAKLVPRDRIMVETDAPFLSPEPVRKIRPCEPKFVVHTGHFIARLRGEDEREFERQLDENTARFFGITLPEAS